MCKIDGMPRHPDVGKTDDFPKGELKTDDEGGLKMSVGTYKGNVVIDFGTAVTWFAAPPEEARGLANLILKHAGKLEKKEEPGDDNPEKK